MRQKLKITINDNSKKILVTALLLAGGAIFTTFCVQYLILDPENFTRTSREMLMLNALCILAWYLLFIVLTKHVALSCTIAHCSMMLLAFADYFVYLFRGNEFSFADIRSIGTGLSVADNYKLELNDRGILVLVLSAVFIVLVTRFVIAFTHPLHVRIISSLLIALCAVVVWANAGSTATETWEQKGSYRNGYVLNFVLGIRDSFVAAPDGYSSELIASLESEYDTAEDASGNIEETEDADPTIIVIMNESFSDLSVLGDFETNQPLTPFMDSLTENTIRGYALSSVFGAKTPNSEWEFMTGNSMAFLPSGSVVYQQYISDTPTSIVSSLKDMGYTCVAMHPYYETGWSRNQVYPNLGYDETYFIDDFDQTNIIRKYITDQELYDKIIDRYESRKANEKLYLMGITMQNHGGYTETYDNFTEDCYKIGRSYTDANQYFSLIHQSDIALENLITYFSQVEDPVEIVFFGDHQPSLNSEFYPILNGKGLSGLTEEELEALYTVPFFIWTNYESEAETIDITSLNFLSTLTLERAGLTLPAYNQFLSDMMEVVPAINSRGYYSKAQGGYIHVDEATGEEKAWIAKYQSLQYNSMFDKKGRSDIFFPYNLLK